MRVTDKFNDISDEELIAELGRRLKRGRILEETVKTASELLQHRRAQDPELLKRKITSFTDLPARAKNVLTWESNNLPALTSFHQVTLQSRADILKRKNTGQKTADVIEAWLNSYGYSLRKD